MPGRYPIVRLAPGSKYHLDQRIHVVALNNALIQIHEDIMIRFLDILIMVYERSSRESKRSLDLLLGQYWPILLGCIALNYLMVWRGLKCSERH